MLNPTNWHCNPPSKQSLARFVKVFSRIATVLLAPACASRPPLPNPQAPYLDRDRLVMQRLDEIQEKLKQLDQKRQSVVQYSCSSQRNPERTDWSKACGPRRNRARDCVFDRPYQVVIDGSHRQGPNDALITLVVWSNFSCPFCKLANRTLEQLKEKYGEDLRIVFKHNTLPSLFKDASRAALATEASGQQGKFWEMHDLLFASSRPHTEDNLFQFASSLGLDLQRFRQDLKNPDLVDKIARDRLQAHALGARGTPSCFINGRYVPGVSSLARFSFLIDQILADACFLREACPGDSPDHGTQSPNCADHTPQPTMG